METSKRRRPNHIVALLAGIVAVLAVAVLILSVAVAGLSVGHKSTAAKAEPSKMSRQLHKIQDSLVPSYWRGDLEGKPGAVELELRRDDKLVADDGCNRGWGSWSSYDGVHIRFGTFVSTLKGCPGLADLWLYDASYGEVSEDGSTMDVYNADGSFLGQLHRIKGIPRDSGDEGRALGMDWKLQKGIKFRPYFLHHYHHPRPQPELSSNR